MQRLDLPPQTRLLLVRHGESTWNQAGRMQGQQDPPLTETGLAQAASLARRLATGEEPRALFASDLQRARHTAEFVSAAVGLPVTADPRFREAALGRWEGLTRAEIRERFPKEWSACVADPLRQRPEGSERLEAVQERAVAALREAAGQAAGGTLVVIAHGGPLRALLCALLELPLAGYMRFEFDHTGVTIIERAGATARLRLHNDTAHLRG